MQYSIPISIEILERTPAVLKTLLSGLSDEWTMHNEGGDTWTAYDVVGHMIHGETTDWIQRMEIILDEDGDHKFKPFDRFAMFEESKGKTLNQLLDEFETIRHQNLQKFKALNLQEKDLDRKGIHPTFGEVSLRQLLATWVGHDMTHLAQITRVIAKQYKEEVGPWAEFLSVIKWK